MLPGNHKNAGLYDENKITTSALFFHICFFYKLKFYNYISTFIINSIAFLKFKEQTVLFIKSFLIYYRGYGKICLLTQIQHFRISARTTVVYYHIFSNNLLLFNIIL